MFCGIECKEGKVGGSLEVVDTTVVAVLPISPSYHIYGSYDN